MSIQPHGMAGEQYRRYPKSLLMRQVSVDARDKDNRVEQFKVVTTTLDASVGGGQLGALYERRWDGETTQADRTSRGQWVGTRRIGYHRRDGVDRIGRVVPATPGGAPRRNRMSATTRSAPPRA